MDLAKKILLSSATVSVLFVTSILKADTNALVFPPANVFDKIGSGYTYPHASQYPPQQLRNRKIPQMQKTYNIKPYYSQQNQQQRYMFSSPVPRSQATIPTYQYPSRPVPRMMPRAMPNTAGARFPQRSMTRPRQQRSYPRYPAYSRPNYYKNNSNIPFSNNMMPFANARNNNFLPFSNGNIPFGNNFNPFGKNNGSSFGVQNNPMSNMFGNRNGNMPFFNQGNKKRKKAWGKERNIWPDFYTDFTDESWDRMMSGPRDLGVMPGGWRFPYLSTPDPVTVSDAIVNQLPPIAEEAGKMSDVSDWGMFNKK